MIPSSFLEPNNKVSLANMLSFGFLLKNCYLPFLVLVFLFVVLPFGILFLDLMTSGESRSATIIVGIFYILCLPLTLMYSYVSSFGAWLLLRLQLDAMGNINHDVRIVTGVVDEKKGRKTWGSLVDEYVMKLENETSFYIDKNLYTRAKRGNRVKLAFLPRSKVVIRYSILNC